ncbi:MAG TPA: hypothetical protein VKD72_37915, partial [Gemmataceae bacterium]|nr:hypothetical protein [Gemmataceae bacterium]
LFLALMSGEHAVHGFANRDLCPKAGLPGWLQRRDAVRHHGSARPDRVRAWPSGKPRAGVDAFKTRAV